MRAKTEQLIESPAADIWAYAADVIRHPEWMTVTDARLMRGTGADVGSRGRERMAMGPFKWDAEFEVAEAIPGRRIVWRSVSGVRSTSSSPWISTPPGRRAPARPTVRAIEPHGLWRLLAPLLAAEGKAGPERELRRLKENVERSATPAAATS